LEAESFLNAHFSKPLNADTIYESAMLVHDNEDIAKKLVSNFEKARAPKSGK
jgi:hypothetical protein